MKTITKQQQIGYEIWKSRVISDETNLDFRTWYALWQVERGYYDDSHLLRDNETSLTVEQAVARGLVDRLKDGEVLFCEDGYVEAVWDAAADMWRYPTTWGSAHD